MTMRLYEIVEQLESLLMLESGNFVDASTGEILTKEAVDDLEMAKEEKIENCLLFVKNMNAEADMIDAEIKKLTARKKACENKAAWCKDYVQNILNGEKFKTARVAVSYTKRDKVEFSGDIYKVPDEFLKYEEPKLKKTEIAKALKAGQEIYGCSLVPSVSMNIK